MNHNCINCIHVHFCGCAGLLDRCQHKVTVEDIRADQKVKDLIEVNIFLESCSMNGRIDCDTNELIKEIKEVLLKLSNYHIVRKSTTRSLPRQLSEQTTVLYQ